MERRHVRKEKDRQFVTVPLVVRASIKRRVYRGVPFFDRTVISLTGNVRRRRKEEKKKKRSAYRLNVDALQAICIASLCTLLSFAKRSVLVKSPLWC